MLTETQAQEVIGSTAYSNEGDKLGTIGQLFLDDQTGRPEFITVNTGFFGTSESFVPVAEATFTDGKLTVPFSKDKVKDAPNVDLDGRHLDESEEARLYEYYGMPSSSSQATGDVPTGPTTDDAMTRSEEQVRVGTTSEESGRVRLRKYVTTEHETHTVPVRKEKAVLEREPITDGNAGEALDGPAISEEEHEVVLREERPVVEKTTEPVERVRVGTETVTDEETVSEEVRKEQVEVEDDTDGNSRL